MKRILCSLLFSPLLVVPHVALANVLITEIMYDLEGSDSGYEWIEVTNTGSALVDISAWRLVEQGVNHKLKLVAGASSVLAPKQPAIFADKPEAFVARYPDVQPVFDTAFSLSNDGETLMLKNGGGATVDQVTYRAVLGAKGDGASLHLEGEVLRPALPNPGVYPGELVPVAKTTTSKKEGAEVSATGTYATVASAPSGRSTIWPWLMGLLSIIGVGIAGALYIKAEQQKGETTPAPHEFEIVED